MSREHNLAESVLLRWRKEYEERGEGAFTDRNLSADTAPEMRIAELERYCGQLSFDLAMAKKALSRVQSRGGTP